MRSRLTLASLLLLLPALPAAASVPGSITGVLGNDIGFFLAQSDFCHWNMTSKIHSTYDSAFAQIGMTAGPQAQLWQDAATRQKALEGLPPPPLPG